jgi:hypothetical protein
MRGNFVRLRRVIYCGFPHPRAWHFCFGKSAQNHFPGRVVATRLPSHRAALRGLAHGPSMALRSSADLLSRAPSGQPCSRRRFGTRPPGMAEVQVLQEQKPASNGASKSASEPRRFQQLRHAT